MQTHSTAGFGLTLLAVLFWGAQLPIAKVAMVDIDVYTMTLVRYGVAAVGLTAILAWREGVARFATEGQGLRVTMAGVIGMAGSGLLVFIGLALTRSEVAVIIISLQPAMTAIAEWIIRGVRPARFTIACLVLAFAGVAVVVTRGGAGFGELLRTSPQELVGNAFVFAGASAWIVYTLLVGRLQGWSSLRISALTCSAALGGILVVSLLALAIGVVPRPTPEPFITHGWRLAYLSVLGVLAAMFLWNAGLRRIGALNAMLLLNLMPVVTFAIRALEGASFVASELIGASMVVGALMSNNLYLRWARRRVREAAIDAV
ncbi:MAG: DMT family transporter [Burkholderiaceae bacterium]|nr:DMT family transporter [Burkholderiaceae bacterium]